MHVLQHFSFCTKPFSAVIGCRLHGQKPDIQRGSSLSQTELVSTAVVLDCGYLARQKSFRSLCLCWYNVYILSCNLWLYEDIELC